MSTSYYLLSRELAADVAKRTLCPDLILARPTRTSGSGQSTEHHLLLRCNYIGASFFDFGWAHFGLDEANDCSAGVTLRSFVILPFTGDFAYRLNVAAAGYAGSFTGAREHASVDAFEEAVVRTTPNGFDVVYGALIL